MTEHLVTVGFRCKPEFKSKLATIAKSKGLTLSAYVESFLNIANNMIDECNLTNAKLSEKLTFYENDTLYEFFNKYKGKNIPYTTPNGSKNDLEIKNIEDVYTIMVNSFK